MPRLKIAWRNFKSIGYYLINLSTKGFLFPFVFNIHPVRIFPTLPFDIFCITNLGKLLSYGGTNWILIEKTKRSFRGKATHLLLVSKPAPFLYLPTVLLMSSALAFNTKTYNGIEGNRIGRVRVEGWASSLHRGRERERWKPFLLWIWLLRIYSWKQWEKIELAKHISIIKWIRFSPFLEFQYMKTDADINFKVNLENE